MVKTKKNRNKSKKGSQKNTFMKMNCNPRVKDKTISKESCFTNDTIIKLRDHYNKNNNKPITSNNPKKIWNIMRKRIQHCNKEDCWLNEIHDSKERQQLDDLLFAPDKPRSWEKNPISWLSNYDIAAVLKQYELSNPEFKLMGPSAIDYDVKPYGDDKCVWNDLCRLSLQDLQNRGKTKIGIVFNLDKHDEPGSHWVAMFVDLENNFIFYFDSALNPVPRQISKLKSEIKKQGKHLHDPIDFNYIQNDYNHQKTNTECGMYCLFFIVTLLTHKYINEKSNKYKTLKDKETIDLFLKPGINDEQMKQLRNVFFNEK